MLPGMRIFVIGATGRTGQQVVEAARAAGHLVTALVRQPDAVEPVEGVTWVAGDVRDEDVFDRVLPGHDVVICTLGHVPDSPPDLCSTATGRLVAAMARHGVPRLVVVSGAMIGHPRDKLPWSYRLIESILPRRDKIRIADRREQERVIRESGCTWTIVRAPWLKDGTPLGKVTVGEALPLGAFASVRRSDLARWMVQVGTDPGATSGAVAITN